MDNKKRKLRWQLPFLLLLVVGTIYVIRTNRQATPYQQEEGAIFGTFYHVTYQCDSSLQQEIESELRKVDASLSPFNTASVISRINRNEEVTPDSMFVHVFRLSKEISENTQGAFDITVAPLVNAWGFGFKNESHITPTQIDSLLQFVGFRKIDFINGKIVKQDPRVILDCSAVAKGYGSDVIAQTFDRKGIANYMVEIGGEIVVKGDREITGTSTTAMERNMRTPSTRTAATPCNIPSSPQRCWPRTAPRPMPTPQPSWCWDSTLRRKCWKHIPKSKPTSSMRMKRAKTKLI